MSYNPSIKQALDKAQLLRRAIFIMLALGIAVLSIFLTFQGLSSARAMEQAQIGRELARGNGYSTKVVRPATLAQFKEAGKEISSLKDFPETYHAPLNPVVYAAVLKAADAGNTKRWLMPEKTNIYALDRIIAAVCITFFLLSIGVNYLLLSRVFDTTIAAVTALMMVFCELFWQLSQTGLPQMLMLFLFSCAMLYLWKAIEKSANNEIPYVQVVISGIFMCLLVLTHWITVWVYIGFVIYAALYFKPRGMVAAILIGMLFAVTLPILYFLYLLPTGHPFGTAFYAIHDGLGNSEELILRSLSPGNTDLRLDGLLLSILTTSIRQISDLYTNLGALLVAPVFFIALLHPFKRTSIASFRWGILVMWILASIGMSIYGLKDGAIDSNQIHILFAPIMTAYGLAMIAILWGRLDLPQEVENIKHIHFIIIIMISAGPMLLSMPKSIINSYRALGQGGIPHYPTYYPISYNRVLPTLTKPDEAVISDSPWATAWYSDRISVWLPTDLKQIREIEYIAERSQTPVEGVIISPYSYNKDTIINVLGRNGQYDSLYPLVFGSWAYKGNSKNFTHTHPEYANFSQRYPHPIPLLFESYITFYSKIKH